MSAPLIIHAPGCTKPAPVFGLSIFTFKPEMRCPECDAHQPTKPKDDR